MTLCIVPNSESNYSFYPQILMEHRHRSYIFVIIRFIYRVRQKYLTIYIQRPAEIPDDLYTGSGRNTWRLIYRVRQKYLTIYIQGPAEIPIQCKYRVRQKYLTIYIQGPAEIPDDLYTGSGRNTWRFCKTVLSGTVGVGNLSLSALLARLKAFQLPWSVGL